MGLRRHFESLMNIPCQIYAPIYTKQPDGTSLRSFEPVCAVACGFHTTSHDRLQFADKIGTKTAYVVRLPLPAPVAPGYFLQISGKGKYMVVGVRDASVKFENIAEVVAYE